MVEVAEIVELLARLNTQRGLTIVMVTHEPELANVASRVVVFRDGRIDAHGTPTRVLS